MAVVGTTTNDLTKHILPLIGESQLHVNVLNRNLAQCTLRVLS